MNIWMIPKTWVSLALHPKRYETRLKHTVGDCNVVLFGEIHCFEKHPKNKIFISTLLGDCGLLTVCGRL